MKQQMVLLEGLNLAFELIDKIHFELEKKVTNKINITKGFAYKTYEDVIKDIKNFDNVDIEDYQNEMAKRINYILEYLKQMYFDIKNMGDAGDVNE